MEHRGEPTIMRSDISGVAAPFIFEPSLAVLGLLDMAAGAFPVLINDPFIARRPAALVVAVIVALTTTTSIAAHLARAARWLIAPITHRS